MNNIEIKRGAMSAMIEDWRLSGKSKKQYCLEHGLNVAKFYYWYARFNEKEDSHCGFIPIENNSDVNELEVIYPNGVKLKVKVDLFLVSQLIRLY